MNETVISQKEISVTFKKWYNVYGEMPNAYNMNIDSVVVEDKPLTDEEYSKASTEWFIKILNEVKSEKN